MEFRYDEKENGWSSDIVTLTGETFLSLRLPSLGRVCLRKSNTDNGPWPIILMTPWTGPDFRVRLFGQARGKRVKILCTDKPQSCEIYKL